MAQPAAWLVKVTTNLCLNRLESAPRRRERYVGQWLPEPVLTTGDALGPMETAEQRDTARFRPVDVGEVADALVTAATGTAAHRLPDLGGPDEREAADLARRYLKATGRRRPVWAVPLPGKAIRDFRAGRHLTPDRVGRVTFDDFLAAGRNR